MASVPIAVPSVSFSKNAPLMQELRAFSDSIVFNTTGEKLVGDRLRDFINQNKASIVLVGTESMTESVLTGCPQVRFISKYGVGLDNLDLTLLKRLKIGLGWTPGVNKRCVAELVMAFMLGHCRNVFVTSNHMKQGQWNKNGGFQLTGKRVGIVGLGNVGCDLASLLKAFGCDVVYHDVADRSREAKSLGIESVSYSELLSFSQFITFHVPGDASTFKMFGPKELDLVKNDALVINTSRGSVVDFEAMMEALKVGKIGGFATDVYPDEPLDGSPYRDLDTLYMTPHIGGNAREAVLAMGRSAIGHIGRIINSGRL